MTSTQDDAALSALLTEAQEARAQGNPKDALGILVTARKKWGDHDRILFALAGVFGDLGMHDGAVQLYEQLRAKRTDDYVLLNNLALALDGAGRGAEGLAAIEKACALAPQDASLHVTKALLQHHMGALDEAEKTLHAALGFDQNCGPAWLNLAEVLTDKGDLTACLACQRKALEKLGPLPLLRFNLAHTFFKMGLLNDAWALYEARFEASPGQGPRSQPRATTLPRWKGDPLNGGTLLVWMEQGVGEEILYASLLEEAQKRAGNMVVECAARLVTLFARSFPQFAFQARQENEVERDDSRFTAHIPAASLGGLFRNNAESFPAHKGYLQVDHALATVLRETYRTLGRGPIIGVSWRSAPRRFGDPKSIPAANIATALRTLPAVFVSLQYGDTEHDVSTMYENGFPLHVDGAINPLESLDDFAAQVAACDGIITVSNTTAHMAGALNIPTAVLVPAGAAAPHHWFYKKANSPWYPSLSLIWQESPNNWDKALREATQHLGKKALKK